MMILIFLTIHQFKQPKKLLKNHKFLRRNKSILKMIYLRVQQRRKFQSKKNHNLIMINFSRINL